MKHLMFITFMMISSHLVSQESGHLVWNKENKKQRKYQQSGKYQSPDCKPMPYYYSENENYGYAFGEWIYWKAVTGDPMNWEMRRFRDYNGNAAPETEDIEKRMVTSKYDFASGFKVGAGVRFKESAWEQSIPAWQFEVELTHIFSKSHFADQALGEVVDGGGRFVEQFLRPLQYLEIADFDSSDAIDMKGTLSLSHTRLDGLFAWPIWIQDNVILRLMTGPSLAWFNNRWTTYLKERASPSSSVNIDDLFMQWKWHGGGIMGGADIYLPLGAGVGIFTNSSFALLMGPMTLTEVDDANSPGNDPDREITNTEYSYYTFQPTISFELGADYKKWICDVVMLHAAISWEYNWWFDLNQFGDGYQADYLDWIDNGSPQAGENFIMNSNGLGFHGLNIRLGIDY